MRFNRAFVNDAQGNALYVNQAAGQTGRIQNGPGGYLGGWVGDSLDPGHIQRQLVANGEVLGRYGDAPDRINTTPQGQVPKYVHTTDFQLEAQVLNLKGASVDPVSYTVVGGETLRDVARNVLGDASLWWRIADANALAVSADAPLTAGQTLSVPKLALNANSAETFQPYDPSKITGSMDPTLPMPAQGDKCGGMGKIIMAVVAVVVAVWAPQFLGQMGFSGLTTGVAGTGSVTALGGAVGGAAGSIASQAVGVAIGAQDGFSWKGVAMGALAGGISAGLPTDMFNTGYQSVNTALRMATANALTQGVAVATGLQKSFDWRGVAAAGVGAGVGAAVSGPLTNTLGDFGGRFATGVVAGTAAAIARGGKVAIQQVAVDAFGNALGDSFVGMMQPTQGVGAYSAGDYTNEMDRASDNYSPAYAGDYVNEMDRASDNYNPASEYGYRNGSDIQSDGYGYTGGQDWANDLAGRRGARPSWANSSPSSPRTYTVRDGDNPASIGRAFFGDERAGAAIMANSGLSPSVRGARSLQIGQVLTIPDSIGGDNLRAGGQLLAMDATIRAQDAAAKAQQATNAYSGMSGDEISARYFANGNGRFSTYQADQAITAQNIAVALGGGFGIPDAEMSPYVASGMGNPVTAAVAGAMADATMSTVRIASAMNDNPIEAAKGFIKKGFNYGPEAFNAAVNITKLTAQGYVEIAGSVGLMSPGSVENFRNMSPYQVTPLFAYNGDAQVGGAFLGDVALGYGAAKYGDYSVKWNTSSGTTFYTSPIPFRLEAPQNFNYGALLRERIGEPPAGMVDPHAHHILFKEGNGAAQKALVQEGQALLRRYDIDPIMGPENMVWAPNRVAGQHHVDALRNVVDQLKQTHEYFGTREAMVESLTKLGQLAARRK